MGRHLQRVETWICHCFLMSKYANCNCSPWNGRLADFWLQEKPGESMVYTTGQTKCGGVSRLRNLLDTGNRNESSWKMSLNNSTWMPLSQVVQSPKPKQVSDPDLPPMLSLYLRHWKPMRFSWDAALQHHRQDSQQSHQANTSTKAQHAWGSQTNLTNLLW